MTNFDIYQADSIHPSRAESMRHFVSIPYARRASDSIHGFAVIKDENEEESNGEKEFTFRV